MTDDWSDEELAELNESGWALFAEQLELTLKQLRNGQWFELTAPVGRVQQAIVLHARFVANTHTLKSFVTELSVKSSSGQMALPTLQQLELVERGWYPIVAKTETRGEAEAASYFLAGADTSTFTHLVVATLRSLGISFPDCLTRSAVGSMIGCEPPYPEDILDELPITDELRAFNRQSCCVCHPNETHPRASPLRVDLERAICCLAYPPSRSYDDGLWNLRLQGDLEISIYVSGHDDSVDLLASVDAAGEEIAKRASARVTTCGSGLNCSVTQIGRELLVSCSIPGVAFNRDSLEYALVQVRECTVRLRDLVERSDAGDVSRKRFL